MFMITWLSSYYCNYGVDKFGLCKIQCSLSLKIETDILITRIFRLTLTKCGLILNGTKVWNLVMELRSATRKKLRIMHRDLKMVNLPDISVYMRCIHTAQLVKSSSTIWKKWKFNRISDCCCWIDVMIGNLMSGNLSQWVGIQYQTGLVNI